MTLWKHCPVGLIKHVLFWYSDFNHLVSINGRLCLQFITAPLDSRSIPSETLLTWLHKSALVLQIESTQDTFIILSLDCVCVLHTCGKHADTSYDLSEREVISDRIMSEERQPDVSRPIKYSNNGLCDPPRHQRALWANAFKGIHK